MLKKQKALAKRQIKNQDDLLTTYENALSWYQTNKKKIYNIGIAIVIVMGGVWWYYNQQSQKNEKAGDDFAKVFTYYDNGQYHLAIDGVPERNIRGLQAIVSDYGSTKNGNIARFYLGNCYYNLGEYANAKKEYEEVDAPTDILSASCLAGIASCDEATGDFSEAAKYFERAGKISESNPNTPEYLANAARNYAKAGNKEQAIELYKYIKKEHASSAVAREAERYLEELRG